MTNSDPTRISDDQHNNAPAVPQGDTVEIIGIKDGKEHHLGTMAMPPRMKAREIAREQFGHFVDDDGSDAELCFGALEQLIDHMQKTAATPAPAPAPAQGEPFGYFRAEPFGWTDCSEDAEGAIALYEHPAAPAQEVGLTDEQADAVSIALRRAWQLGQTYWQQADSDYISQHKKSEETQRKFEKLCDDTIAALRAKGGK